MFNLVVDWIAVAIALPVVLLVVSSSIYGVSLYQVKRMWLVIDMALLSRVTGVLSDPRFTFTPWERAQLSGMTSEILKNRDIKDRAEYDEDDQTNKKLLAALYGGDLAAEQQNVDSIIDDARQQKNAIGVDIDTRLSPLLTPLDYWLRSRFIRGQAKLKYLISAIQGGGLPVVKYVLRGAGEDVTTGSVVGLIIGVVAWFVFSRFQDDFILVIGNGVTLGAFSGLAKTAVRLARRIFKVSYSGQSKQALVAPAIALISFLLVFEVLTFIGPSWWPGSKR